ncbi:glycoside hydrolase family 3 N-terminal domain-containing protein [Sphingomonas sp. AX6]|uniref:glycoside hydrolase family 3 N-terminal domain-containing protein n=1 Tax=Sphingomonas sp. AX6 TaxID=2653171 RepID=UPI0012F10E32|nr:glycoside hydrolase family 3 N-terminal domain-containing protein [Sphingomonas sp. AX6]VXC92437.1 Periplasmic beta-glucosidase [Sphingomonas sp. AX6]
MIDARISRRAALAGIGMTAAWAASPARALMQAATRTAVPAFVEPLLARMTIEEKAGQLSLMAAAWGGGNAAAMNPPSSSNFDKQLEDGVAGRLTGVFNGNGVRMADRMQRAVMERSRLKIPLIFGADVIHGHRTVFPMPVGEAATFEPDIAERTARIAAFEAAGAGIDWTFAPMVDVARDQRWGRSAEGAGEDVMLNALFAAARTRGFQGKDLSSNESMMACPKHFVAYGAAQAGLDYNTVDLSERTLREVYFPPFQAAYDAGAMSTMSSFNEISGIPSTGNAWLLTQVLRDEFGFTGIVVSDYTSDEEMIAHGYAADGRDAARIAILAGVDLSMQSNLYYLHLPALVQQGLVPMDIVDRSVRRILTVKSMLGLFDDPFRRIDIKRETTRSRLPKNLAYAREVSRKSIVMLENKGDLLPLPKSGRIALIGPFAGSKEDCNGPQCVYADHNDAISLAAGVRAAVGSRATVTVTEGTNVEVALPGGIEAAVAAANAADVVVLALGEGTGMAGEAQSRTDIRLPEPQQALAEAVAATGKPIVVILKNGRAMALHGAVRDARAILVTWFLGSETGSAMADILFGDHSPEGRLPISFPFESGQQPYHYDRKATGRPAEPAEQRPSYRTYWREGPNAALWPFGHGLTYGRVEYSSLKLPETMAWGNGIEVTATVTNRGKRACVELVQLYIRDRVASVTRPVRQLKKFEKVALRPGQSRTVRFTLSREDLLFVGVENKWTVEPGDFDLWIAPSAQDEGVKGEFRLVQA